LNAYFTLTLVLPSVDNASQSRPHTYSLLLPSLLFTPFSTADIYDLDGTGSLEEDEFAQVRAMNHSMSMSMSMSMSRGYLALL